MLFNKNRNVINEIFHYSGLLFCTVCTKKFREASKAFFAAPDIQRGMPHFPLCALVYKSFYVSCLRAVDFRSVTGMFWVPTGFL